MHPTRTWLKFTPNKSRRTMCLRNTWRKIRPPSWRRPWEHAVTGAHPLLCARRWIYRAVTVICAVSGTLRHQNGRAARGAVAVLIQALQVRDGGVECVTFCAQLSQYVFQIHGNVSLSDRK